MSFQTKDHNTTELNRRNTGWKGAWDLGLGWDLGYDWTLGRMAVALFPDVMIPHEVRRHGFLFTASMVCAACVALYRVCRI